MKVLSTVDVSILAMEDIPVQKAALHCPALTQVAQGNYISLGNAISS